MKLKSQIEAILFLSDKPVKASAMARIVSQDVQVVRQALLELIHDYEERDGGLEITDDDGYLIQVRDAYAFIVDEFAPMEMPIALVRTLSAIAIKQPVAQSEVIKIRGAGAYDHIKELILRDLITKREEGGRSPMLGTTKKFQEYFRLTQDAKMLRTQLNDEGRAARKLAEGDDGVNCAPSDLEQELVAASRNSDISNTIDIVNAALASIDEPEIKEPSVGQNKRKHGVVRTHTDVEERSIKSVDAQSNVVAEKAEEINLEANLSDAELQARHLESKINLEKVFAGSPDASLVFRPTTTESNKARAGRKASTDDHDQNEDGAN